MEQRCDLHTHSTFSDGSFTPAELVQEAERIGLSAIALTDHNTTKGLAEFMEAGSRSSVITAAGCEFSTEYCGIEVHIVGMFLPQTHWDLVEERIKPIHEAKTQSNYQLIENLQKAGYQVTYEEAAALTDGDAFNRAHIAQVLHAKGYVESVQAAFSTFLKAGAGFYVPPKRLDAFETISFIRSIGGTAVLAHPFLNFDVPALQKFLPPAIEAGLDAMETHYTKFDAETTRCAESLAAEYGLLQSGGSDFHGKAKPDTALGSGRGELHVPYAFYETLYQANTARNQRVESDGQH